MISDAELFYYPNRINLTSGASTGYSHDEPFLTFVSIERFDAEGSFEDQIEIQPVNECP